MFYLLIDILLYNYTRYKSMLFILNINNNSLVYNIAIGLFIDYFIIHMYFLTTIYLVIVYLLKKHFKLNNITKFYLFNILTTLGYYLLLSRFNISTFINIFIINSIFILISYKKYNQIELEKMTE